MPAHMETPLDVTHPSWYHTDGTARTIRSGAPSLRSTTSYSSSSNPSHSQPNSQLQSRKSSDYYNRQGPPSSAHFSASASSKASMTSSARRARGPGPQSKSKPDTVDLRGMPTLTYMDRRPTVGEDRRLTSTRPHARDPRTGPALSQSQTKRHEQAARFRSHPRARATPAAGSVGAAHGKENLRRARVPASTSTPHSTDYWRDHARMGPPPSQDSADIQKGDLWYKPAPPKPSTKDILASNESWYRPASPPGKDAFWPVYEIDDDWRDHSRIPSPAGAQDGAKIWKKGESWYRRTPPKPPAQDKKAAGTKSRGWYVSMMSILGSKKS